MVTTLELGALKGFQKMGNGYCSSTRYAFSTEEDKEDCAAKCRSETACRFFTYRPSNDMCSRYNSQTCTLKSPNMDHETYRRGMDEFQKMGDGYCSSTRYAASTEEDKEGCAAKCRSETACKYFTYRHSTDVCSRYGSQTCTLISSDLDHETYGPDDGFQKMGPGFCSSIRYAFSTEEDIEGCAAKCRSETACKYFTYRQSTDICSRYNSQTCTLASSNLDHETYRRGIATFKDPIQKFAIKKKCSGGFFQSEAWALSPGSKVRKAFDSADFKRWAETAWAKCLEKNKDTKYVTLWTSANYKCHTESTCSLRDTEAGSVWTRKGDFPVEYKGQGSCPKVHLKYFDIKDGGRLNDVNRPSQGFDTNQYMRWVRQAWLRCYSKNQDTKVVSVTPAELRGSWPDAVTFGAAAEVNHESQSCALLVLWFADGFRLVKQNQEIHWSSGRAKIQKKSQETTGSSGFSGDGSRASPFRAGLQGEDAEFNGDYVREHRRLPYILASWRLENGSSVLYLEQAASLVRFARTVRDVEHRRWFLSAKMSAPAYRQSLWAGNLSDWMLHEEPITKICLRPIMGRWANLAPDLGMSERPVARHDQAQAVKEKSDTLPYTKGRCHQWTQNAAVAELVQNWKDEIDAGAERSGYNSAQVKVSYSSKRDRSHLAVSTYQAVLCEDASDTLILLGTIEVREESESLSLTLTNFSDKMFVEMLWDGWAGKDKEQGNRRGQFGDGLQSAVVVLSRDPGVDLKIFSSGHEWSFDWSFPSEVAKAHGKEALRVTTKASRQNLIGFDCGRDTRIKITGLQKQAFDESQFLFLCPPYEVISNSSGDILLSGQFRGCMYVREMRVLQHQNAAGVVSNRQGLNIASQNPGQSRDRIGFLSDAAKHLQTIQIWKGALSGDNRSVAALLYDALTDRSSLEARAFHLYATQTDEIVPAHARLLADVFAARHPNCFAILETDYRGHKIVTQKLKKQAINIPQELFQVLRKDSEFKTPEEYWKMQQEQLAQSAERISWTEKYHYAVTICQEALRNQVSYEVSYDSDPADDIFFKLSGALHDRKIFVSRVSSDGPASRAFIGIGSELVGIDFPSGTERINAQQLRSTRFQALVRERPLSFLNTIMGWRYPFKLQFLLRPAELNENQFSLVCREDLEVPFVALPGRHSSLQQAKFVINTAGCKFHDAGDSYHCPYFATQGVCFCGVDHLLTAILEEMEKSFNIHLNKIQKQWVDVEKNRLLRKHEKIYKVQKPQVVLRPPGTETPSQQGLQDETIQRIANVRKYQLPVGGSAHQQGSYLSGSVENLSEEERKILSAVRLVVAEVETQNWEKRENSDPQAALLGSQLIQFALAVHGNIHGLPVKSQLDVYKNRLSTRALAAGSPEAGQEVEGRVGRVAMRRLEDFSRLLQPHLSAVRVPPGNQSLLDLLDAGIQGVTLHGAPEMGAGEEGEEGEPARVVVDDDDDEPFGSASAEDKAFLQLVQSILLQRERTHFSTHFSKLTEEIRRQQVAIPARFQGSTGLIDNVIKISNVQALGDP
eukprot:s209_g4.t2